MNKPWDFEQLNVHKGNPGGTYQWKHSMAKGQQDTEDLGDIAPQRLKNEKGISSPAKQCFEKQVRLKDKLNFTSDYIQ